MTRRAALLLIAVLTCMAPRCGGTGGPSVIATLLPVTLTATQNEIFEVTLVVTTTNTELQAFDVSLEADPVIAVPIGATPHPEFDDDGALFTTPVLEIFQGRIRQVVDLRHGSPGRTGTFAVVTLQVLPFQTGTTELRLAEARFAAPDGTELSLTTIPATVTVVP